MRVALQLYTVRDDAARDFAGVLDRVAALGFAGVELHDLHGQAPDAVRALLDGRGLVACGRHAPLEAVEADVGRLAGELAALGTDRLVVPWIEPPSTPDERDAAAARLAAAARAATRVGLRLGFHNHDAELRVFDDGRTLLDCLLATDTPPFLELDLGWAWYAGADPMKLLRKTNGRAPLVHVKDLRRNGGPVHVPLGAGAVDYAELHEVAAAAGVEWLILEQDEADGPAFDAVERSLDRLRQLEAAS